MHRNSKLNPRRPAFTVLELLVVIAVIAVLIGLLLPALNSARETARCLQCKNNLRQLSVAMQLYHDSEKHLPQAWTLTADHKSAYGWSIALLPYLEHVNLSNAVRCDLALSSAENEAARHTELSAMICPSDISDSMFDLLEEADPHHGDLAMLNSKPHHSEHTLPIRLPVANYLGVFGTVEADETVPAPQGDGSIVGDRMVRYTDLERGQSKTILIGERTTARVPSTWYGVNFRGEDAACRLVGSAITAPNCTSCDECEFVSRHSGGVNFAWADGHVSLVPNGIDSREYQQMSKRRSNY